MPVQSLRVRINIRAMASTSAQAHRRCDMHGRGHAPCAQASRAAGIDLGRLQCGCHGAALANQVHAHHHRAAHGTGRYRLGITASTDRANTPTISVATMRDSLSKHDNNAALQAWRDPRQCDAEVMTQLARTQLKARRTHGAPHCLSTYPSKGAAHGDQDN
ncbi:hypothetical protein [Xanthomonas arboricola]|uniref:hypothetical protein n=1 Tax=Xanthomonas arboricola TaxID=56448 RepID=UPI002B321DD6|nr:hypothetical protein X12_003616 [Xanthomonas arboricola]